MAILTKQVKVMVALLLVWALFCALFVPWTPLFSSNQHRRLRDVISVGGFIGRNSLNGHRPYDFSVLLVSYHKTGHDLQMDLVKYVVNEFTNGPTFSRHKLSSLVRQRTHSEDTLCSKLTLTSGTIAVQHAPDFFCTPDVLARMLVDDVIRAPDSRGTKIVHLVRNPFSLAVSNYNYHSQDPTPENWVYHQSPCETRYTQGNADELFADYILPTLSRPDIFTGQPAIATQDDFDRILADCQSLYQTKPGLKSKNLYRHLTALDPHEGIRLSTSAMMIQGDKDGGDIMRMANDIIKFKETEMYVRNSPHYQKRNKKFQVYTLSMDDFIAEPAMTTLKFLDFIFDHSSMNQQQKEIVSKKYEQSYYAKKSGNIHITHGKFDTSGLKDYLRNDPTFGPPLKRIETLVEEAAANHLLLT